MYSYTVFCLNLLHLYNSFESYITGETIIAAGGVNARL